MERNPYLIIGVDFAASAEEARHAFAHAARRIRRQGGAWAVEDLTWALHEIETLEQNPADLVTIYRIPADPSVFEPAGEGLYRPLPVPIDRQHDADSDARVALRRAAASELDAMLLDLCQAAGAVHGSIYDEASA
jgi:hypothetical protein